MSELSAFENQALAAEIPILIQLYSLPTPNGVKASIMLEETGLPYEAHLVAFGSDDQMTPEFLSLNPNNKIAMSIRTDRAATMPLWESGAILIYLAEKTDVHAEKPGSAIRMPAVADVPDVGPMFGQLGHFYKFAADKITDLYPTDRYMREAKRLLGVLDDRLTDRDFIWAETTP